MRIGIIGAGNMGATLAGQLARSGHEVAIANSRGPGTIADVAARAGATAVPVAAIAGSADLVIVAIPEKNVPATAALILLKGAGHLAGGPAADLAGLVPAGYAGFVREVEAASLADDGVRCRLKDDGERLDPAQFLLAELAGGNLPQAAQWLFLTSLFAAALAFHNAVWRYAFALGREGVLPGRLGRTGSNNIPKAASLAQSATGLAVIGAFALAGWPPMTGLFFGGGTTGGFGILLLLALTSVAVIAFFARNPRGESAWSRLIAPALAAIVLAGLAVLAVLHYGTLLGVSPGAAAAWALPASYAALAAAELAWGLVIKIRRPGVYAAIGLGAHATRVQAGPGAWGPRP